MPSRIFVNSLNSWQSGEGILLSKDQTHYLTRVLRLKESDQIEVVNKSTAQVFLAELLPAESTAILTSEISNSKFNTKLNLIFAYCKSDKNELIIEKGTELGVDNFIIYQAKHSIAKLSPNKSERLEKIAEAASCQSKRNTLPKIHLAESQTKLHTSLQALTIGRSLSLIASLEVKQLPIPNNISDYLTINFAVGPEGDFTTEEYKLFKDFGFLPISLGRNILRSETAAIAGISYINILR